MNNEYLARFRAIYNFICYLHLSRLIMDPIPAVADNGVEYSNCFRRRTNHKSTKNIINATNLMLAHSPTYLLIERNWINVVHSNLMNSFVPNLCSLVSKGFNVIDETATTLFATCRFPQKARRIDQITKQNRRRNVAK